MVAKLLPQLGIAHGIYQTTMLTSPYCDLNVAFSNFLKSAKTSIRMMCYSVDTPDVATQIGMAYKSGLDVKEIFDLSESRQGWEGNFFSILKAAGQLHNKHYKIGTSPVGHKIIHVKATVIDHEAVELGSYNYTTAAQAEVNNLLIIESAEVAKAVEDVFDALWQSIITPPS
jgi:phosphatidylserine/phosphatidylglycerophosphate/cardiolipin synthase-like enzyme